MYHGTYYTPQYKSKQISLLILEDDCNDESVQNFVDYIKKKNEEYEKKGDDIFFLFRVPVIARSKEEFERLIIEGKYGIVSFDIVICDIEIKNSDGFLVSLGFNMIESIIKLKKSPIYYIVTNVSRSFYDQIKKEYISRIRLKKEVFGTEESIRTFLYGVKERYEQKKSIDKDTLTKHENLFNELIKYVKNDEYSFIYKYKNRDNSYSETITKYEELEKVVKTRCNELIKAFLLLFNNKGFAYDNGEIKNYCTFNDNCNKMRDYIRKYVGKGNDAWCNNYSGYDPISNKDLQNFLSKTKK